MKYKRSIQRGFSENEVVVQLILALQVCYGLVGKAEILQMTSSNDQICIPMSQRNSNGLPGMTSSDLKTFTTGGDVLSFHNICYRVKVKSGFLLGRKVVEKEILSNVNGIMKPGLNAILGPTGGGKSSLLDVLAARKDPHGLSGDVLVNGAPQPANFKCNSGYVVQDDVVMGTLTVRENLQFSAALRLPTTTTNHEKNERINKVIEELGLSKVADSKVGTQFIRGVSGGERKRTSIAMELITDPSILFLDEPTTGLDSSTANAVLLLLKRMSKQGRTIIFSIHQPRYSIFKLFDSLTLLASGKLMFHGPAQEALGYFESAGYHCEPYNNPADFFLDVINGDSSAVVLNREIEDCEANNSEETSKKEKPVIEKLAEFYTSSSFCRDTKAELDQLSGDQKKKRSSAFREITYVTSFCHQLRWITKRSFKNLLGNPQASIAQDDVVMGTLTVRENLQFSAALRLPTTMTNHEKNERINKVIQDLGLSKVADLKVGTQFMWGVSGGERKRTHIAMELITDPPILFLDEPTTGLDSSTASAVLLLLKRISEQGRTIIFSIHQPQYSIFKLFDHLTLLASGKLIFHGPAQEALGYFESIGYPCEPYNNPADFFLDVISGDSSAVGLNREEEDCEGIETEQLSQREKSVIETLVECYANSSFCKDTKAELDELSSGQKKKRSLALKEITYVTSFCHQLKWIIRRSFKNLLGNPRTSIAQIIATIILGLVVGATFLGLKNDCMKVEKTAGLLLVLMVCECFSSVLAGQIFVVEEKLFIHEYVSGYYRLLSYFFGKLLFDLLPRKLLPSIIFTCIIYVMAELKPEAGAFFVMIVTVTMVAYSASSMALAMATDQSLHYVLTLLMNLYFVFMMVLLVISLYFGTIPPWLSWIQYFSIPHYGFKALQHNEFLGRNYCSGLNTRGSNTCSNYVICTGEEFLTIQGMDLSPWGLWQNYVGLAVLMIFFLTITYLKLLFLKKYS
ncbi:ATP-binding cassette sub-family G member 2 [Sciurus carolinensis]|uniref:ATP-binding cassette sub-family G member 2 n=1 Tax=Sciurus carolinensis TaxID=30640 RepID=A0AA41NB49_SCICA|nr:ATP-binding cassette sub-family G member 2 [Sciurus carolinensis]